MNIRFRHMVLMMAATLWFGCGGSGDEPGGSPVPQPQPNGDAPISFSGNVSEGKSESHARTRTGTTALSATHQTFYVWAYKNPTAAEDSYETVMQKFKVNWRSGSAGTSTTNSSGWEYVNQQENASDIVQSIKYWDFNAAAYRFFGYTGTGVTTTYSPNEAKPTSISLSFTADAPSMNPQSESALTLPAGPLYTKLWYRKKADLPAQKSQPVTLEFLQPYVKVRFLYKVSDKAGAFLLEEQRFGPTDDTKKIATAGTFTVTYYPKETPTTEVWTLTPNSPGVEGTDYLTAFTVNYFEDDDDPDTAPDPYAKNWYIVMPAKDQGTYTLSLKVNNKLRTAVVPEKYMNWEPYYQYTYIFKITESGALALEGVLSGFAEWTTIQSSHEVHNW